MRKWFECKVAYERQSENGGLTRVSEAYLVEAGNFTEAEARIIEKVRPLVGMGNIEVTNVMRRKYADIFLRQADEDDKFYRIKVMLITYDEKADKETKSSAFVLMKAENLKCAVEMLEDEYKMLENYEIVAVTETALLDVYPLNN